MTQDEENDIGGRPDKSLRYESFMVCLIIFRVFRCQEVVAKVKKSRSLKVMPLLL